MDEIDEGILRSAFEAGRARGAEENGRGVHPDIRLSAPDYEEWLIRARAENEEHPIRYVEMPPTLSDVLAKDHRVMHTDAVGSIVCLCGATFANLPALLMKTPASLYGQHLRDEREKIEREQQAQHEAMRMLVLGKPLPLPEEFLSKNEEGRSDG